MFRTVKAATAASSLALAIVMPGPVSAETAEQTAAIFGARQSILDVSLSPDGNKIAYIAPSGTSGEAIYVVNLAQDNATPAGILENSDIKSDLDSCNWASNEKLVCRASFIDDSSGLLIGFSRLFIVDADGSGLQSLTRQVGYRALGLNQDGGSILALEIAGKPGKMLMTREFVPEVNTGTRTANTAQGLGVEEVDIENLRGNRVEQPNRDAVQYIADSDGRVRIMVRHPLDSMGRLSGSRQYYYRTAGSDKWNGLVENEVDAQSRVGFFPVAVDSAKNVVYGFDTKDGYDALFAMALDGSRTREEILSRDDVDVDQLIRIGRRNRVVGASYATEKRQIQYVDPELEKLASGLAAALPGKPLIDIVDASGDESKLLIVASSDVDPGMVYLYDKQTRQLAELLPVRDRMAGREMGAMTPVSFKATDGVTIPGYLTLPPGVTQPTGLPAIVLPHGGPSARDEWGFDWLVQFFAARGYVVLQPNYRGSSGYGTAWFGKNGFQAWKTAVGDVNDAGRWLVSQGIADPDRLAAVGWSYGGYAALQSHALDPQLYKAIVAIAPVTDLERLREESRDFTSFAIVDRFIGRGEHVKSGSPSENAARIAAPVLLVHGTLDQNVGVQQSRLMKDRLEKAGKEVKYIEFDQLDHGLADSAARKQMLAAIDAFLASYLGK